jgi:hypothetical protein
MKQEAANSISAPSRDRSRDATDYLYQGATIVAALLLLLSAAV